MTDMYDKFAYAYRLFSKIEAGAIEGALSFLDLGDSKTFLDIGCGPGLALRLAGHRIKGPSFIIGLDRSRQMIDISREKHHSFKIHLIQGDALKLPLASDSFDSVFLSFTLELFEKKEQSMLLEEVARVLKEDGKLAVVSLNSLPPSLPKRIYEMLRMIFPDVLNCRPIDLIEVLRDGGFETLNSRDDMLWGLPVTYASAKTS